MRPLVDSTPHKRKLSTYVLHVIQQKKKVKAELKKYNKKK